MTLPIKHKATQPMHSTKAFNIQCCFNVIQRRRSWPDIERVLGECLVFAGRTASYFYRLARETPCITFLYLFRLQNKICLYKKKKIFLQICRNTMQSSHLPRKHKVVHHHVSVSRDLYLFRYSHVINMSL